MRHLEKVEIKKGGYLEQKEKDFLDEVTVGKEVVNKT